MEYECSWIGQGERLVDSRRKNGASKKEDNKYIPLETMIELGLIKLVQVSYKCYFSSFSSLLFLLYVIVRGPVCQLYVSADAKVACPLYLRFHRVQFFVI